MRDGYQRGVLPPQATRRQMDVLAAYVAAGGSVHDAAELVGIRPSTVKRHLADLRARSGLTTEQLIYSGRALGWLVVPSLEPARSLECRLSPRARPRVPIARSSRTMRQPLSLRSQAVPMGSARSGDARRLSRPARIRSRPKSNSLAKS